MDMPREETKEAHIDKSRMYEVDEIATNCKGSPPLIIPKEYWEEYIKGNDE